MLPAKGAVQIGLFDRVVEKGSVLEAGETARRFTNHSECVCCATSLSSVLMGVERHWISPSLAVRRNKAPIRARPLVRWLACVLVVC